MSLPRTIRPKLRLVEREVKYTAHELKERLQRMCPGTDFHDVTLSCGFEHGGLINTVSYEDGKVTASTMPLEDVTPEALRATAENLYALAVAHINRARELEQAARELE